MKTVVVRNASASTPPRTPPVLIELEYSVVTCPIFLGFKILEK